jgi:hypothetical protein
MVATVMSFAWLTGIGRRWVVLAKRYKVRNGVLQNACEAYRYHRSRIWVSRGGKAWLGLGLLRAMSTGRLAGTDYVDRSADEPSPDLRRRLSGALTHPCCRQQIAPGRRLPAQQRSFRALKRDATVTEGGLGSVLGCSRQPRVTPIATVDTAA